MFTGTYFRFPNEFYKIYIFNEMIYRCGKHSSLFQVYINYKYLRTGKMLFQLPYFPIIYVFCSLAFGENITA